jgi:carboxymethylenebutenolidase
MRKLRTIALLLLLASTATLHAQDDDMAAMAEGGDVQVMSGGMAYESYLAAPAEDGVYPGIVLIHSFNGLEQGYRDMTDQFAAEGFVVLAVGWQTFTREPDDATMMQLVMDSIAFLTARDDVDAERLGLTGFCAGGRYTMRYLPQIDAFGAGVAWYGFPTAGSPSGMDLIDELDAPLLIIHGTEDRPSPIADIYAYATALADAGKSFELKVYQDEPHGFMLSGGELRTDEVAMDAFGEMVRYFQRKLGE